MNELNDVPSSLAESEEWRSLDEDQRSSLLRRIESIRMLGRNLSSGTRLAESSDFVDFSYELELDVAILQELDSARRGGLSRWLIHHSWSFETSPSEMRESLPCELFNFIDDREPAVDFSIDEYDRWFKYIGNQLVLSVNAYFNSKLYASMIAIHVLIDILLARLLIGCYKLRLNKNIAR